MPGALGRGPWLWEDSVNLTKHVEAEIVDRRDLASDLWIIRLRVPEPLPFKPGQYVTLGVADGAKLIERPYSVVSSPLEPEIEIFFELVPHGELTPRLYKLGTGDRMFVRRTAKGVFTLDRASGRKKHFMLATVTGVAPYVSIVRTLAAAEKAGEPPLGHELFVIEGASRSWELGYDVELAALEQQFGWLHFVPTISRPWDDAGWTGEKGRVDDIIRKYLDRFACGGDETTGYLCGHPGMIEAGKGILRRAGFPEDAVEEEKFWVPAKESA
jgi:ferredoxin--NADP+ reductase